MGVFWFLIVLLVIPLLASCSFFHKNYPQESSAFDSTSDFVVQIDDYGEFWDPQVPARALEEIAAAAARTNTIVLIFIHGWHHNAKVTDRDAVSFAKSVAAIRTKLDDNVEGVPGMYRQSRINLTGDGDVKIIGIYIGWRGKSLPMPLDYLTFWDRKATAERVGQGDLKEFLIRLNGLYRERLAARAQAQTPFMGMISFGHSFGGQVLFRAVAGEFERELIEATAAGTSKNGKTEAKKPIEGFGTMTVLVNPAIEASQYERLFKLSQKLAFDSRQTPVLLVVSSATDLARKVAFPLGRRLSGLFRASPRKEQKELWIQALGEYEPHRTHAVELVDGPPLEFNPEDYIHRQAEILSFDLTDIPSIAGVRLTPNASHKDPFSPFLVAYASGKVVIKHSGIFEERLRNFLNDYVALTQGKKILLASPGVK